MVQGRSPSQDDFRYWIGKNLHKYIRGGLDKEEVNALKSDIDTFLSKYEEDISLQLSLIVPISLPPGEKPGFSKKLVTDCEMSLAKVCGGFTTLISEGGWYDNDQFVKDYHRSIYAEFKLSSWVEVCRTLTEIVLQIQESAKQRCVWVSIDGVAAEVNLLREKEIESFPQQSEFGGVDPEFSEVETKRLPEKYEPIPIHQLNANFSFNVGSGILGGTGNKIDNSTTYVTNNHYAIPDTSKPALIAKNSVVDKIEAFATKEIEEDLERQLVEFEKHLITYPKEKIPKVNQNYPSSSVRRFIGHQKQNKLNIDFDDVYNDWNEINQFIWTRILHTIVIFGVGLCALVSLCNILGLSSINEVEGLELFFIGAGLMLSLDYLQTSSTEYYNPVSTIASYFFVGPITFAILLMPIIGLIGTALHWVFGIEMFWIISFNSSIFTEYFSFFTTNLWAYSLSLHIFLDIGWRLNMGLDNQLVTRNVDNDGADSLRLLFGQYFALLFAGYLLNICSEEFFNLGVVLYFVFFGFVSTLGLYILFRQIGSMAKDFHSLNPFFSESKEINLQVEMFQKGDKAELSERHWLVTPSFQLHGRYHLNAKEWIADYTMLAKRVLLCDLIRNSKFNVRKLPGKLRMYLLIIIAWVPRIILTALFLIFAVPCLILILFLSLFEFLSGMFQEKTYFFTISENLFNLDHNRIKNDIQPRIHEMSWNSAIDKILTSYNYNDCILYFFITDFLCYASGTEHATQVLKSKKRRNQKTDLTKKKQRKRR